MSDWYPEAEQSINLCKAWTSSTLSEISLAYCQFYLFGSAIYLEGEQFDALRSDLDIVCVMPDGLSAVQRVDLLAALKTRKATLELEMIPKLGRDVCDVPGVSIVALTPFEVAANVHKSGARSFFDKNFFFDLILGEIQLGLPSAGDRAIPDVRRQALEFCQKQRNDYLAVSANNTGGLADYRGLDPMPKALMRCAAQIVPNLPEGGWYDTRHGLEHLFQMLQKRSDEDPRLRSLYKAISIRRGGKGHKQALSAEDQLQLSELLYDQACTGDTEEVVRWEVRVEATAGAARDVFEAIRRIVPDARLRGQRDGSIVLTLLSSLRGFELFQILFSQGVLKEALGLDVLDVRRIQSDASEPRLTSESRLGYVIEFVEKWLPPRGPNNSFSEAVLVGALLQAMVERLSSDSRLAEGTLLANAQLGGAPSETHELDFVFSWPSGARDREMIGFEVAVVRTKDQLMRHLSYILRVRFPTILLVFAPEALIAASGTNISRMRKVNANVRVVLRDIAAII